MSIRPRPWLMLAAMVLAQASTTVVAAAPAFLIVHLHETEGLGLAAAGLLAGAPNLGLVCTLVLWGAATDRFGERRVILLGLAATAAAVALAMLAQGFLLLGLALVACGAMSACANSASGRLITGWFPPERRGLAMGIRQTCQPLGMAVAALCVPPLASRAGVPAALALGGALVLVSLVICAAVVVDPARIARSAMTAPANPYRETPALLRIHLVSMLLVVPQFALSTFGLVWFTVGFGWSALAAGALVAASQFAGAAGRIAVGVWSDQVRSAFAPCGRSRSPGWRCCSSRPCSAGRTGACSRRRPIWSRAASASPTTAWPSPRSPRSPGPAGPGGRSACRTPASSSCPPRWDP